MYPVFLGRRPHHALLIASAALLSGCSTYPSQPISWLAHVVTTAPDAGPVPAPARHAAAEDVEADGRAAQVPPSRALRLAPDDPTQPWSPNYGRQSPIPIAPAKAEAGPVLRQQAGKDSLRQQADAAVPAAGHHLVSDASDE